MKNTFLRKTIALFSVVSIVACSSDDDSSSSELEAATISGGPFEFTVDGEADYATGIEITEEGDGETTTWIITNEADEILGLPTDIEAVDFDAAGGGTCFIWYLGYDGDLENLEVGNTVADLSGDFALSNSITVTRIGAEAATISGGPFDFTVGDGTADNVSDIEITDAGVGEAWTWVVTDETGETILGLPADIEAVDFDGQGTGVCLIWYLNYNGELENLVVDGLVADITGEFALSNSITVNRN